VADYSWIGSSCFSIEQLLQESVQWKPFVEEVP